jgi:SEA/GATOR complex protein SEA1/DEPDC5
MLKRRMSPCFGSVSPYRNFFTRILHHDIMHNPATAFHFELNWISTSARCLEELIRQWSRSIEKYGLRLVEGTIGFIW